jgi:predicted dehydrogenase
MSVLHLYPRSGTGPVPKWIVTEEYGGILWESMVHDVYLAEYLLGNIRSAMAFANKLGERVFDSLTLVLQEDRKVAVCQTEWAAREPVETIDVLTMEGDRFMIDLPHDLLLRRSRRYQGRRTTILRTMFDDLYDPALKWSRHLGRILRMGSYTNALPFERTFATVINQYLSFLAGATPTLPVPPEEGLRSIMVLEAARRSIKTGRPQPVKQII